MQYGMEEMEYVPSILSVFIERLAMDEQVDGIVGYNTSLSLHPQLGKW
jgi:hypothetical protein